jgi:PIN domain nuclease of toxin-antitoxin system
MNLLFDTQAFLWWATAPDKLSGAALTACQDRANTLILSAVSVWEIQIKLQLGKLTITSSLERLVENQVQVNRVQALPVLLPHVYGLATLPSHHKDPFDRLLIAQAVVENLTLVSADRGFALYPVTLVW